MYRRKRVVGRFADAEEWQSNRYFHIDVLRGIAIVMMVVFHFVFDLDHFQYIDVDFDRDPFWVNFRTLIVTIFLCLVGISLQLATGRLLNFRRYFRRLVQLVGAAAIVSFVSYSIFPDRPILFGVLHFIALASVLGLLFRRFYWMNLLLGVAVILLGIQFQSGLFDSAFWYWAGLMRERPITSDYVPLFPWFGVVLIGMYLARVIEKYELLSKTTQRKNGFSRLLALGGRHSLLIYLLHQPLFFGGFYLVLFVFSSG